MDFKLKHIVERFGLKMVKGVGLEFRSLINICVLDVNFVFPTGWIHSKVFEISDPMKHTQNLGRDPVTLRAESRESRVLRNYPP